MDAKPAAARAATARSADAVVVVRVALGRRGGGGGGRRGGLERRRDPRGARPSRGGDRGGDEEGGGTGSTAWGARGSPRARARPRLRRRLTLGGIAHVVDGLPGDTQRVFDESDGRRSDGPRAPSVSTCRVAKGPSGRRLGATRGRSDAFILEYSGARVSFVREDRRHLVPPAPFRGRSRTPARLGARRGRAMSSRAHHDVKLEYVLVEELENRARPPGGLGYALIKHTDMSAEMTRGASSRFARARSRSSTLHGEEALPFTLTDRKSRPTSSRREARAADFRR